MPADEAGRLAALATYEVLDTEPERAKAGALHDIGTVAIPDAIMKKPGPLSDPEWAFVRTHTVLGERILAAAPALSQEAALVRSSHERWDGEGYPDRLAGEDIPLGSRIIFVAEAIDAMTSDWPYRAARTLAEALAEIQRCAGTQFDPTVAASAVLALAPLAAQAA